jgi:apolipoprotein N-acyltransferase
MRASNAQDVMVAHAGALRITQTVVQSCVFASVAALLFALAFPPFDLWPLAFVAVAPLAWIALRARSTKTAVVVVFFTQFLMWLWLNRWIINVTVPGYPALGLYMSLYPALFAWIVRRAALHPAFARLPMTLVVPVVWTGVEFLRGDVAFNGYPWYFIAHPLINWPVLAQAADISGAYGVSFLAAMVSGALVDGAVASQSHVHVRRGIAGIACAFALLAANIGYGAWRMSQTASLAPGPSILAIQTNLPQDNKIGWSPDEQIEDFIQFCELTLASHHQAATRGERVDLIAWPETMLPGFGLEPDTLRFLAEGRFVPGDGFARGIEAVRKRLNVHMLLGSPTYLGLRIDENDDWTWDTQYNSAYLVQGDPPFQRYDKYFLTPFGETMPYISNWKWLETKLLALGARGMRFDLSSNPHIKLLTLNVPSHDAETPEPQSSVVNRQSSIPYSLGTPICFEDTVAALCRRMIYELGTKRADVLVNLSNDGWFAQYDSQRLIHAQIARFRCIENRVPMVRVVNTGVSVYIDSAGRIIGGIGAGTYGEARQSGALLAATTIDSRTTIFGRVGDLFGIVCLLIALAMLLLSFIRRTQTPALAS